MWSTPSVAAITRTLALVLLSLPLAGLTSAAAVPGTTQVPAPASRATASRTAQDASDNNLERRITTDAYNEVAVVILNTPTLGIDKDCTPASPSYTEWLFGPDLNNKCLNIGGREPLGYKQAKLVAPISDPKCKRK